MRCTAQHHVQPITCEAVALSLETLAENVLTENSQFSTFINRYAAKEKRQNYQSIQTSFEHLISED